MSKLLGILALLVTVIGGVVFLWPGAGSGPEAIEYGRDACANCRMHISQPGFGGELRDRQGILTKYDDLGCMLTKMLAARHEIPESWVEDHGGGGFVPLLNATLVRATLETPMGSGIIAFKDAGAAEDFISGHGGAIVALEDLVHDTARLLPARLPATAGRTHEH